MIETDSSGIPLPVSYATALAQGLVSYDCKLYLNGYLLSGDIISLTVNLGSLSDAASDTDGFMLGGVYSTSANFSIYDCPTTILNEDIELQIGVDVGNSFIYVTIAQLTVISARTAADITDAQAVGFISSKMAAPTLTGDTMSVYDLADAIYTASGVQVDIGSFNNDFEDITITDGVTCREALAKLAKHLGGYACEVNDGTVLVSPFPITNTCSVSDSVMTTLPQIEDETYDVDGVTVQAAEDVYIEGTGRVPVEYADATQGIADQIWDNVDGYFYTPALLTIATLDPRITPFDRATFTLDGVTYSTHTLGIQAKYDGGYFGTISAAGLSSAAEESLRTGHVESIATQAERAAAEAQAVAEATGQHFWYDADGAHITEMTKDAWQTEAAKPNPFSDASAQKPYNNLLMTSLGILLRSALSNLVSITRSAIAFFDGLGNNAENVVASFGASGAQIGYTEERHVDIDAGGTRFYGPDGAQIAAMTSTAVTSVSPISAILRDWAGASTNYGEEQVWTVYPENVFSSGSIKLEIWLIDSNSLTPNQTILNISSASYHTTIYAAYSAYTADLRVTSGDGCIVVDLNPDSAVAVVFAQIDYYGAVYGPAFTFGSRSDASKAGNNSFAAGGGIIASQENQAVFGAYNVEDTSGAFALIVGNGTDDSSRSNALAVGWDGHIEVGTPIDASYIGSLPASKIGSGTLAIANGGTGQSSVSSVTNITTLITAASGTTITAATFKQWGKLAMLTVSFRRNSSWAANAQVDVGTVKTNYRPAVIIGGGNANVLAHLNGSGVMRARNMTGASIGTSTTQDIGFTFLLP